MQSDRAGVHPRSSSVVTVGDQVVQGGFPGTAFRFLRAGGLAGADEDGTLTQWKADIRSAIQEMKRKARVESMFIGGLRLGASLAAMVSSGRDDIEGLVLWDPIINGGEYLGELTQWHKEKLMSFLTNIDDEVKNSSTNIELIGFRISEILRSEIEAFDLGSIHRKPAEKVLLIESQPQPKIAEFVSVMKSLGSRVDYRIIESFKMLEENPDKGLVPQPILQAAINWILQESA